MPPRRRVIAQQQHPTGGTRQGPYLHHFFNVRVDAPTTPQQKAALLNLTPAEVQAKDLAGEPIQAILTTAPGDGAPVGGVKVVAASGWFAVRPSGTEDVYKLYAESFKGREHLQQLQADARALVAAITPPA